jgi:hypothetical protein
MAHPGYQSSPSISSMFRQRSPSKVHNRTFSVISTSADQELCAVAELMSPAVIDRHNQFAEEQEQLGVALDDELNEFIEPSVHQELEKAARARMCNSYMDPELSPYPPPSPSISFMHPPPSPSANSLCSDSELDQPSDSEPVYLPKTTAYPAFHLPRPRPRPTSVRDSDTPSLSSSTSFSSLGSISRSQSRRNSPPISPASLVTPIEYQSTASPHLAIIEERNAEDQDYPYRLSMESSSGSVTAITFAVPEPSPPPSAMTEDTQCDMSTLKKRMPHLEHLKLNAMSPSRRSRSQSPSQLSLSSDGDSLSHAPPYTTPLTKHRGGSAVSFTRFLGGKSEKEAKAVKGDKDMRSRSIQSPTTSILSVRTGGLKEEIKQRKAEEKQRKKVEAKAKTEQLALELKEKARQRKAAQEKTASLHSSRSGDRKPIWAEGPSMYGSLGTL